MPEAFSSHPSAEQLAAFAVGKLSKESAAQVAGHLEGCADCRQAIDGQPPDSFVTKLVAAAGAAAEAARAPAEQNTALPAKRPLPSDVPAELASSSKYEVLGKLGQGGMGSVWKAKHAFLDCLVAIKVMSPEAVAHPEARARFLQEMKAAGRLRHDRIVRAFDAEQAGDLLLLVMEFVEGASLEKLVRQKGPLPVGYACRFVSQAAEGLQHAHEKGMVHRDIKPANLMVTRDKQVKVLDFGLARLPREQVSVRNQTKLQTFMGTPEYVAPEQATDARTADIRADIYSLGCTLFFLLTGRPPFQHDTVLNTIVAHLQEEPPALSEARPDAPPELGAVVAKMLAKKPEQRYQTPREVIAALEPFLSLSHKGGSGPEWPVPPAEAATSPTHQPQATTVRKTPLPAPSRVPATQAFADLDEVVAVERPTSRRFPPWLLYAGAGVGSLVVTTVVVLAGLALMKTPEPKTASAPPGPEPAKKSLAAAAAPREEKKITQPPPPAEDPPEDPPRQRMPLREGFVTLFNGEGLNGWAQSAPKADAWKVDANGNLVGIAASGPLLSARGDYRNFHYVVQARVKDGGRAGQLFRASGQAGKHYTAKVGGRGGEPACSLAVDDEEVATPSGGPRPGEWFTQEVIAVENHVVVKIDGRVVLDKKLSDREARHAAGHLGLQALGQGAKLVVHRVAVKELPASVERFAAVVPARCQDDWRVEALELVKESASRGAQLFFGEPSRGDYNFSAEVMRTSGNDDFALCFRCSEKNQYLFVVGGWNNTWALVESVKAGAVVYPRAQARRLREWPDFAGGFPDRKWVRAEVRVRGSKGECWLNGTKRFDFEAGDHARGMVGLRTWRGGFRFRDIQLTDPDGRALLRAIPDLQPGPRAEALDQVVEAPSPDETQVPRGKEKGRLTQFKLSVSNLGFFQKQPLLLVAERPEKGSSVSLWNYHTGKNHVTFQPHPEGTRHFAVSTTGLVIATHGNLSRTRSQWKFWLTNERKGAFRPVEAPTVAQQLRFLDGGRLLSLDRRTEELQVVDIATGAVKKSIKGEGAPSRPWPQVPVAAVAFSFDGAAVVAADHTGLVRVWDTKTGKLRGQSRPRHPGGVRAAAFLPDGKRVVTGGEDGTVRVWDVENGREVARLSEHQQPVNALAATANGKWVVSGGQDGLVYLWDAASGKPVARCAGHAGPVHCLAVSPDGGTAASGGEDKIVRFWELPK